MASSCLSKSKHMIMQSFKSKKLLMLSFVTHASSVSNSQLCRHLHVRNYANSSVALSRCFGSVYGARQLHTATSVSNEFSHRLRVRNYANSSWLVASVALSRSFGSVYGVRQLHTATSVSNESSTETSRQELNFPGGKVKFTPKLIFTTSSNEERTNCYRVLDEDGQPLIDSHLLKISKELAVKMYTNMVTLQVMDTIFYEAQRQGRISFYLTTIGEEAINIASAAALNINDFIFPQYREPGVLLWRGFSLQEFANQLFGNKYDNGKGRQMPIHYGSKKLNYVTVASTVATQIPQAVGAAYSMKMEKQDSCTVTYFGDGGSSTGDFHAALNFAAVMEAPVIFFCRNNGWAISTPIDDQLRSDGIVVRGKAYGIPSIRVDGNDALAVYSAVYEARKMAIEQQTPVLIEALTYRAGHHSTSDDSTKYRPVDEIEWWRGDQNPVKRFRNWIETKGWWSDEAEAEHRSNIRKQLSQAIQAAERVEKPPVADMFNDVYDVPPKNLSEQEAFLRKTIKKHAHEYSSNVPM